MKKSSNKFRYGESVSSDLFESQNSIQEIACCICYSVPTLETAIEEVNCGRIFCENCLLNWNLNSDKCPYCQMKCLKRSIIKEGKFIYRTMANLRMRCPLNCGWVDEYRKFKEHMNSCGIQPCKYAYLGCTYEGLFAEKVKHEQEENKHHLELAVKYIEEILPFSKEIEKLKLKKENENYNVDYLLKKLEEEYNASEIFPTEEIKKFIIQYKGDYETIVEKIFE